jgi:hypothetical protein
MRGIGILAGGKCAGHGVIRHPDSIHHQLSTLLRRQEKVLSE